MRIRHSIAPLAVVLSVLSGCVTSGGPSTQDVAASTYRTVQQLNTSVSASLEQLNTTTADLTARLEAYDQQVRRLRLTVEDNQTRLDRVQARLDELSTTLYKQLNLTPSAASQPPAVAPPAGVGVEEQSITVVPPPASGR